MDTKALKLTAIAATMLDGFVPTTWTPLPPLDAGVRVLLGDDDQQLVAAAQTQLDRTADIGSAAEAGRIYEAMYPHADFVWPRLRAITEVDADYFDTSSPTTVTLADPLPGAPLGDVPIADTARASSLAQALATLHSAAPEPVSDAGFPVEDPSRSQFLILERLDQAASTGRVPSSLLQHWEEEFEKVALWHFLATPIHGSLDETSVYTDQERVLALAEIGRLRVADPAIDLAAASALIDPAALPTFYEEYRNSRPRADEHVIARAELLAEFAVLDWLLEAVDSGDETAVEDAAGLLSSFNEVLFGSPADATASAEEPTSESATEPADDGGNTPGTAPDSSAPAATDAPDVEAAITETAAPDVFIPGAQPPSAPSDDDSEFDSEPGSQVRTEPTRDADETDDGEETGRIR
ncbi:aminoglycoside phosphotransferase [Brevibacterium sp. JSBI002]|uniref:aminoglycoside phosphotransferase n=1 Tax=Brevibacterium sp. JSBI002 TaxID=2886045 RepID=UPI002230CB7B|nr:aminoglycoside phosphotransferase [Brevibacterium sp. JSBI002]UZD63566.1 aminoglycoside phosphotransferase [Brevibacterium sp. JSBI002]